MRADHRPPEQLACIAVDSAPHSALAARSCGLLWRSTNKRETCGCVLCVAWIIKRGEHHMQTVGHMAFLPEHDAATNRLHPGFLQQPPHGCLLVDETLEPVQPSDGAHDGLLVRHLRALEAFVSAGVVECHYAFQQVRLPVSGSVTLLSAEPSRFADACHVSIAAAPAAPVGAAAEDGQAPRQSMRAYLASAWRLSSSVHFAARDGDAEPDGAAAGAVPSWVARKLVGSSKPLCAALRRPGAPEVDSARAFDTIVMLLRALAVSQGRDTVDDDVWAALEGLVQRVAARNRAGADAAPQVLSSQGTAAAADDDEAFKASLLHAVRVPDAVARAPDELVAHVHGDADDAPPVGAAGAAGSADVSHGRAMLEQLRQAGQL